MKILVVGFGSIGRRHIDNLVKLKDVEIVYLKTKIKQPYKDSQKPAKVELISMAQDIKADAAFICNETYKHIKTAIPLAKRGMHLFLEKPLSHNLNSLTRLNDIVKKKKIKFFLGYNLRFLPALQYLKEKLSSKALGDLYFARIEAGQYLPDWRKNIDYASCYSASRRKGGGAALDLSHEIDYMRYLFGDPLCWEVMKSKVSRLSIKCEDVFEGLYRYKADFICSVHLDYLQREKRRCISVFGSKGSLFCDFIRGQIILKQYDGKMKILSNPEYFNLGQTYTDEARHFIKAIKMDFTPRITIDDGIKTLILTRPCSKRIKYCA